LNRELLFSCFETLGGKEGLQKWMRLFYEKQASDLLIGFFFSGKDVHAIADRQATFFFSACTGSSYQGVSPLHAHRNLPPILKGHFDRRLVLLKETLDQSDLTEVQKKAWIRFERSFQKVIYSKK
jgi:truncated hemoglobin YjbI